MSDYGCSCGCRWSCTAVAVVASVILGVIAAFVQFAGAIAVTVTLLWVAFGVAVGYLAVLVAATALLRRRETEHCLCGSIRTVLVGILGTALFAVVLLAVDVTATSVIGAILVGLLVLFFTLLLTGTACLVQCIAGCER